MTDVLDPSTEAPAKGRAPRTALEADVKKVCDRFVTGELVLPEGKLLTPHRIANEVYVARLEQGSIPSSGAVSSVLIRWRDIGYAEVNAKPLSFLGYTEDAMTRGLAALKAAHRKRRSTKATAEAAVVEGDVADEDALPAK